MIDHEFKPYADMPDMCVAELADSGDTCNRPRKDHTSRVFIAHCDDCQWRYESDAQWLSHRTADIHRGVYGHRNVVEFVRNV